jgi:GT2 family glycosyltransferase/glycosyltransferase involved in cell wall biosynthesis
MSDSSSAGILILNWNGRDLFQEHLPSVLAAARHSGIPVAVADNGSSDDSLAWLAREYPEVKTIPLGENHGFGRGYNRAIQQVPWEIVILLNNDMAVDEDFADHLIAPFRDDDDIFAVSSQIFFQDPERRREETGRTSARFRHGRLECAHLPVEHGDALVPVFWLGGGSAAVSRRKFEQLGGFDDLYSPFYFEDVDLSFRAWQRGWPTLLAPRSRVLHRHRGSTSRLDPGYVETIVARNSLLFVWLNVRDRRMLGQHLAYLLVPATLRRDSAGPNYRALLAAARLLPAVRRRRRAVSAGPVVSDRDVFERFATDWERPLGLPPAPAQSAYAPPAPRDDRPAVRGSRPLRILVFVPMCVYPISHGGASRIMNTIWGLSRRGHEVHVLSLVVDEEEREAMSAMPEVASSHSYVLPLEKTYFLGNAVPTVVRNTYRPAARRLIAELVRRYRIDVVELEYTHSGAYITSDLRVPTVLVEHDIAYRSALRGALLREGVTRRARALFDVARLYRWEIETASKADIALTASELEAQMLRRRGVAQATSAVPNGVDVAAFEPRDGRHEERDILFVGYFLHPPNVDGLEYFVSSIWPSVRDQGRRPSVTVVGTGLDAALAERVDAAGFRYAGFVEDLTAELWSHRVFVCPIRFGAGTRIKLLEAAAARCAIVSTTLGAEGLGLRDGRDVLLADDPAAFANAVLRLLDDDNLRVRLGDSAHDTVQRQFDWPVLAGNLERVFYDLLARR